jgi:hypothetical protein
MFDNDNKMSEDSTYGNTHLLNSTIQSHSFGNGY